MRAWLLDEADGSGSYRLDDVPTPEPGPGEVRIALRASALNRLDLWVARGMPAPPRFPHVSGGDGAGVVDAVGPQVEGRAVGDEVMIDPSTSCGRCADCLVGDVPSCAAFQVIGEHRWGTHAEAVVVPAVNAVRKPAGRSWAEAAAAGLVTSSAVRMLRRGRVVPTDRVLITGIGGGTAIAAFGLATSMGATVFAASRDPVKRAWAQANGAAWVVDPDEDLDERVRALTDGRGVDVVIDSVGTTLFERAIRCLARGGRYVTNGSTTGRTATLHLPTLFWRQLEVIGSSMNDHREFADAVAFVGSGAVTIPVDRVVPFGDLPEALARLDAGEHLGKIVLGR